ncbi:MAG: AsmA family protein [Chitinophagaceae bacterium]|nr:AsmA family protein [Chitinophagaceae bacterium]
MKKALKITGISLLVLIVAAFALPILFKGKILTLVKKGINENVNAKVDFNDLSLSLFRHFPKLSVALENISVVGTESFAKDTLISAKKIDVSLNLLSIMSDNIKVSGVYLDNPRIHALVDKNGKANWDIAKADTNTASTDTSSSSFKMELKKYAITDGYIFYKDEQGNMSAEISGLNHEGSGDFTQDIFTLSTNTKAESANFIYENIPYLVNAKADIGADVKIDNKTSKYDFKTDDIQVNNLKLSAEGFFQLVNDSVYNMDIAFKSPSNDFKDILSMIPAVYKNDFDKIKTSGKATFNGFVKGTYSPQQLPAYDVKLDVADGFFQYPDLPKPVKNIQVALHASNPDGKMDNTVIDISKGHIEMDNEPFDFKVLFKNPETSRYIDAVVKGKLDLGNVSKFVKLDGGTKLAGLIAADAFAKGNLSAIENQNGPFTAGGFFNISNLLYASKDFPQPIQNGNMKIDLVNNGGVADNTAINISQAHIEVGKDPVDFTLQLQHPVSSIDFSGTAKGRFTLDNVKQFTQLEPGTAVSGVLNADLAFSGNKTAIDKKEYDKINTTGTAELTNVKYISKEYPTGVTVSSTKLSFNPKNVTLNNLAANYMNTNFTANGVLNNLIGYALKDQTLDGTINVTADKMNLNDWMGTDTATSSSTTEASSDPFLVPANINLTINTKADQVKYDKVTYNNINGTLVMKDEMVKLQNVKTEALDGTIAFTGSYATKANKKKPDISISYDIKDVSVQKAFYAFNTFQKLMPIGQFLDGKLSSQLNLTAVLGGDMTPLLNTLTGEGSLLLLQGVLKKFQPLEKLASSLQIADLNEITVKDIKNYIEFANGKVRVKPFTIKVKDIEMEIGGMHGFDQSLDYIVQMKVPRKYLGSEANALVNNLATQASSKGIPVKVSDIINLNVKMGGTLTNPSIKTDLKEATGNIAEQLKTQTEDFVKAKVDSAKQKTKDSLVAIKNQVTEAAKEEIAKQIFGKKDSTGSPLDSSKKKTEETIKNTINDLFKKKKKPAVDTTKKE